MSQEQVKSTAFQSAELRSERLRIFAVLGFVAIFVIITTVRVFVVRTAAENTSWMWSYLLASIIVGYEVVDAPQSRSCPKNGRESSGAVLDSQHDSGNINTGTRTRLSNQPTN